MEKLLTKNTWIGFAASIIAMLLGLVMGALLMERSILPPEAQEIYLTVLCGAAAFCGSFVGAWGKNGHLLRALCVCGALYLLFWILTFGAEGTVKFDKLAVEETAALWCGGVAASLLVPRKKQKKTTKRKGRQVVKRSKQAVT